MSSLKTAAEETKREAAFAFREYFRPLAVAYRILAMPFSANHRARQISHDVYLIEFKTQVSSPTPQATSEEINVEYAKTILRTGLSRTRYHERWLLLQTFIAALVSGLTLAISLLVFLQQGIVWICVTTIVVSLVFFWSYRIVKNRERIIQFKTLYHIMKSVDEETALRVVKGVTWQRPSKKHQIGRRKQPKTDSATASTVSHP